MSKRLHEAIDQPATGTPQDILLEIQKECSLTYARLISTEHEYVKNQNNISRYINNVINIKSKQQYI